jgi:transcription initiation factor TFIID TATA-box-binding protein
MSDIEITDFEVVNVVAKSRLTRNFDLQALKDALGNQGELKNEGRQLSIRLDEYDGFGSGAVEEPPLITLFESGKYNIIGAKSVEAIHRENRRFLDFLLSLDSNGEVKKKVEGSEDELEVVNIVASTSINRDINLEALSISVGLCDASYEPERFGAVVVSKDDLACTLNVSSNGNIVLTGGIDVEEMRDSLEQFIETEVQKVQDMGDWMGGA